MLNTGSEQRMLLGHSMERRHACRSGEIPSDHENHAPDGMCNIKQAIVSGVAKSGQLCAKKFELLPAEVIPDNPTFTPSDEHYGPKRPLLDANVWRVGRMFRRLPIDVVDNDLWSFVRKRMTHFALRDPEAGVIHWCVRRGWCFGGQTDVCGFVTMTQPAQYKAKQRHQLDILTYHCIVSDPDSLGYMAVAIGEDIVWEQTVPIQGCDVYSVTLESFPALGGYSVTFMSTIGANSWKLAHPSLAPTPS